jgi:hypothetical protein
VAQRDRLDATTNDELARLLFRREAKPEPVKQAQAGPTMRAVRAEEPALGLELRRPASDAGARGPITERDRRALFAALSKGTRANVGRDPTVAELLRLVDELERARRLVAAGEDAIAGRLGVHLDGETFVFRSPTSEAMRPRPQAGRVLPN